MKDKQLALPFPYTPALTALDFLPHPGLGLALDFLAATPSWPQRRLALWGEPGAGKTHLLHLWAEEHGAALLAGPALEEPFWPESAVAIDDADRVASEPTLLHILNAAAEARRPVLLTMSRPPARLPIRLPDLASRLRAMTAVEIGPADDGFLAALLARLLSERQLAVPAALQAWLLIRLPRTPAAIRDAVAWLDGAALAAKSGVTQKLAADALGDLFPGLFTSVQETPA